MVLVLVVDAAAAGGMMFLEIFLRKKGPDASAIVSTRQ
jgi:hypothetical protein